MVLPGSNPKVVAKEHIMNKSLAAAAALAALALSGAAAGAATIDDLTLGDHWAGEKWDKDSLRDRTVVVELWGYN